MSVPSASLRLSQQPFRQLLAACRLTPGETVLVDAAARSAGSVVGQMAKLRGCRVVGLATGAAVCRYVVEALGFDACIDLAQADGPQALARSCPVGVDVFLAAPDHAVPAAVQALLGPQTRVPHCGLLAPHDGVRRLRATRMGLLTRPILRQRIRVQAVLAPRQRRSAGAAPR